MFNILNHLEKLNILNNSISSEWVCECPVCGGHRLTISKSTGAYSCWTTECPPEQIRAAIGVQGGHQEGFRAEEINYRAARVTDEIRLARFQSPVKADLSRETFYHYSSTQKVHRYYDGGTKFTIPYSDNRRGKGSRLWFPYRIDEALIARGSWILAVEGEKCVEYGRQMGVPTITWQGSSWTTSDLTAALICLRSAGVRGIVYYPDWDSTGLRKAAKLWQVCSKPPLQKLKFPIVILDPLEVWHECPQGGDIADWCEQGFASVGRLETLANERVRKEINCGNSKND